MTKKEKILILIWVVFLLNNLISFLTDNPKLFFINFILGFPSILIYSLTLSEK